MVIEKNAIAARVCCALRFPRALARTPPPAFLFLQYSHVKEHVLNKICWHSLIPRAKLAPELRTNKKPTREATGRRPASVPGSLLAISRKPFERRCRPVQRGWFNHRVSGLSTPISIIFVTGHFVHRLRISPDTKKPGNCADLSTLRVHNSGRIDGPETQFTCWRRGNVVLSTCGRPERKGIRQPAAHMVLGHLGNEQEAPISGRPPGQSTDAA